MASVVKVHEKVAAKELNHFDRVRSATVSANLPPGVTIGKAVDDLQALARRTLPPGVRTDLSGRVARVRRIPRRTLLAVRRGAGVHLPGAGGLSSRASFIHSRSCSPYRSPCSARC
jgi:hypothetical protein